MEDKKIQELYKLAVSKGLNRTYDEFVRISTEDEQKRKQVYDLAVGAGYRHDFDTFGELFGIQKKKEQQEPQQEGWEFSRLESPQGQTGMESTAPTAPPVEPESTSLDSLTQSQKDILRSLSKTDALRLGYTAQEWQDVSTNFDEPADGEQRERSFVSRWAEQSFGEDSWATETISYLDKAFNNPMIKGFTWPFGVIDESIEAFSRGQQSSDQIREGLDIMDKAVFGDGKFTIEDANMYIESKRALAEFNARNGKDEDGEAFIKAIRGNYNGGLNWMQSLGYAAWNHPQGMLNSFVESMGKQMTEAPLETAGGVIATTTTAGAVVGSGAMGVGAIPGGIVGFAGGVAGGFVAAGASMELGLSMIAAIDEYLQQNMLDETPENILSVLNNNELMLEFASDASVRAATIGALDAITMKAGGVVAKPILKSSRAAAPLVATVATQPIETLGEFTGEALATSFVSDQGFLESWASGEAVLAGLEEAGGSLAGGAKSVIVESVKSSAAANKAAYTLGGNAVSRQAAITAISTSDKDRLESLDVEVKNDKETAQLLDERKTAFEIEENIDPSIQGVDRNEIVQLNVELKRLQAEASKSLTPERDKARKARIQEIESRIETINDKYAAQAASETAAPSEIVEQNQQTNRTVDEAINRKAVLTEYNGKQINEEGDVYVDGQTVVFESDNKIYELGNVDEVSDMDMADVGLAPVVEEVAVNNDGTIRVDDQNWNIQTDLDNRGIEYDENGNVTRVSLKDNEGKTVMYDGQRAEDIAYQIMLSEIQTPEQEQKVNEALEQDEEFQEQSRLYREQRELDEQSGGVETTAQRPADKDTKKGSKGRVKPKAKGRSKQQANTDAVKNRLNNLYKRMAVANTDSDKHRLLSQYDDLVSKGANPTQEQRVMFDEMRSQLNKKGHKASNEIKTGNEWTPDTKGNPKLVPDPTLSKGENVIGRVISPRVLDKDGNVVNEGEYIVRVGTKPVQKTMINGQEVGSKAVNKKGLRQIMSAVFGLENKRADAVAAIGDRMIATMAKRAGISKEEMYDAISFVKANGIDEANNNVKYQEAVKKFANDIVKIPHLDPETTQAMIQDGRLSIGEYAVSDFEGPIVLHSPDGMFAGTIELPGGNTVVGNGGVYYPIAFSNENYFWAGTRGTITTTINQLEEAAKRSKDGKVRMALTMAPPDKLLSNTTVSRGIMDMLIGVAFQNEFSLTTADIKAIMYKSAKDLGISVRQKDSIEEMRQAIFDKLDPDNSSFDQRKKFSESMLGNAAKAVGGKSGRGVAKRNARLVEFFAKASGMDVDQIKNNTKKEVVASKSGMINAICRTFQEDFLNEIEDTKVIYAVIEVDVNPNGNTFEAVDTKQRNLPSHESFPFAIRPTNPNNRVKVHVLKDPKMYYDVVAPEGTSSPMGKESLRAYPTNAGLSLKPLNIVSRKKEDVINDYLTAIDAAKKANPGQYWSVTTPTREELQDALIVETGDAYGYVTPDGDIKGVFKKHDSKASGVVGPLLEQLVKMGGIKLDNFDGYLTKMYEKAGFKIVSSVPFNTEYAPQEWKDIMTLKDEEGNVILNPNPSVNLGTPKVVAMVYDPDNKLKAEETKFNDYDEAMSHRDSMIPEVREKYNNMQGIHLYQDQRAAVVIRDAQAIMYALNNPDVSSPLHEFAHIFEGYLTEGEKSAILDWAGHSQWTNDTSEAFAEGFEKYLSEGIAPTSDLKQVFDNLKNWLKEVYAAIKNTPLELELNDDMRALYDAMLNESNPDNMTVNARGTRKFYQSANGRFKSPIRQTMVAFKKKWIDSYARIINIQKEIQKEGNAMYDWMDFDMAIALMPTKQANDHLKIEEKLDELKTVMNQEGLNVDDVNDYMMARHVKERNAYILARFEKENGSGRTDDWADETLNRLEDQKESLDKAAAILDQVMEDTRQTMIRFGLESNEIIDFWKNNYENYVPLFGFALDEEMSIEEDDGSKSRYPSGGAGMNVSGRTVKDAKGRETEAANVIGNIFQQAQAVAIKGRKNEALQTLMNLLTQYPSEDYSVGTERNGQHSVGVRVNGEQFYITFKSLNHAKTLRGETVKGVGEITNFANKIVNIPFLRRALTSLNPFFGPLNFVKDFGLGMFNAAAEEQIEGGHVLGLKVARRIPVNTINAFRTIISSTSLTGKLGDRKWQQYYEEFKEDGGKVGWGKIILSDEITKDVERETSKSTLASSADRVMSITKKGTIHAIESFNDMFENAFRLASYVSARQAGASRGKAAQFAKNVTVNFNKYGDYGVFMNNSYLFFNPAMQSADRFARTFLTPVAKEINGEKVTGLNRIHRARAAATGLTTLAAMMTMYNIGVSEDDDDGIPFYRKISDQQKGRNLIIMKPDGKTAWVIPIQYGLNIFTTTGTVLAEAAAGERDEVSSAMMMFESLLNSFVPISISASDDKFYNAISAFTPDYAQPFIDMTMNTTYFGGSVTLEDVPWDETSKSAKAIKSPKWLADFFKMVNEETGGSEYVSGSVDINPDYFYYYLQYIGGSFVRENEKIFDRLYNQVVSDENPDYDLNEYPLRRKFEAEPSKFYDHNLYSRNIDEVEALYREFMDLDEKKRGEERGDRYKGVLFLHTYNNDLIKEKLKLIRKKLRKAQEIEDPVKRYNTVSKLQEEQRKVYMQFNTQYRQKRGDNNE